MEPLVSIIIPTYNRSSFIGETLDSILAQTYKNWECIVVDDRSEDATIELLTYYQELDSRLRFIKRPSDYPSGANSCRNIGLSQSKGEYIQWLDSDDLISPEKIRNQIALLKTSDADIATCRWGRFSNQSSKPQMLDMQAYRDFQSSKQFIASLANDLGYFPIHSYLTKRKIIAKSGPWLEGLTVNQDGEFIMRVISNSEAIKFCKEGIALYRRSDHSSTSAYNRKKINDLISSWKIIEGYLKIRFKEEELEIVQNAKKSIFSVCQKWPELIGENQDFFFGLKENNTKRKLKLFLKRFLLRYKLL